MEGSSFRITGLEGEIRWRYLKAATLRSCTLTASTSGWLLTAQIVSADTFRVEQHPLTFHVERQNGAGWIYPVESLHIADGTLTGVLSQE